jgi:oxygen-independent coproporphyrinogen-3 oxidase
MHRVHSSAQIGEAVRALRDAGIANISVDLIFNLPPQLDRDWSADVERALELEPAHVSLYGLTVESHTPISRWAERGVIVEGTDSAYAEEFLYAHDAMAAAGFDHYEVSNFALPGHASRHNSAYWTGAQYAGLGPSAHSFDGDYRRWNTPAYASWAKRLAAGETVIEGEELLSIQNREAEKVYLGLRTTAGLILDEAEVAPVAPWVAAGWGCLDGSKLTLTPTGWLRLDSLAAAIAAQRDRRAISPLSTTPSHCYI